MTRIVRDYIAELRRSPAKSGTIAVLLATGMLLWGRLLLKEVPRTASAWERFGNAETIEPLTKLKGHEGTIELSDPGPLSRDLFRWDPSHYRRTGLGSGMSNGEKSEGWDSENQLRQAVVDAARDLRLTSVIEGEDPVVIINRRLLRVGDEIEGFTVVKFERRGVILERQGVKVRLSL